jgi:alpha-mannosidase
VILSTLTRHTRNLLTLLILPAALTFLAASALAQVATTNAQVVQTLSPDSQKVISRLASFDTLPAEQWRYHAGDLAHGESPDLDDSAWPTVEARSKASTEAAWYRRTIEVPKTLNGYDLT